MDLILTSGEREEEVTVERVDGTHWTVRVGEREYTIDVAAPEAHRAGERLSLRVVDDGRQFEVAVHRAGNRAGTSRYAVTSRRGLQTIEVTDPLTRLLDEAGGGSGSLRAEALMPGRVVEILLEEGAEVEKGQSVLVVEAMKMKNEIQAESTGTLARLFVEAGQNVEAGDPLFEIG